MIERLKSVETLIAGVVALLAVVAKYAAFSSILELPESLTGLPQFLSTLALLVCVLVALYLTDVLLRQSSIVVAFFLIMAGAIGIWQAVDFSGSIQSQTVGVQCADEDAIVILDPLNPQKELKDMIDSAGGLQDAWCDHEDRDRLRSDVSRATANQSSGLTLQLILSEVLLGLAVALAAWLVVHREN